MKSSQSIMTEERYEIRGKIGQGGVGAVYKAYDSHLRREVAIKRVLADEADQDNEKATENLLKEATALSSVQHPHICTVYDAGIDDDGPFVVMELIKGKTLDKMIEKGTLTYEDFREVAIQCEEAMIAAQELNIVHRDLKPSNVMVSWLPSGRFQIKLVDFGLAKFSAQPSLQTIDHGDAVFGSIFFMAPEQFERTPLDQRTDMYSLGALFYYCLAGKFPFDGDTAPQVMASHLQHSVEPLQITRPDLPIWLCEWVMWHIQRDINHRPNSAKDALDKFLADESFAAQGGLGATQQLVTPGAPRRTATGPLLISPATGPQPIQPTGGTITSPLATVAPSQLPANPALTGGKPRLITGPQPILTAGAGLASTQALQAGNAATGPLQVGTPNQNLPTDQALDPATQEPLPQMSAEEEAAFMASQKKPMSKKTKTIIYSSLGGLIVITLLLLMFRSGKNEEAKGLSRIITGVQDRYNRQQKTPVRKKDLDLLLKTIATPGAKNKDASLLAIVTSEPSGGDFNIPLKVATFAMDPKNKVNDGMKKRLFEAASWAKPYNEEAYEFMLDQAVKKPNKDYTLQIVKSVRRFPQEAFFEQILEIHDTTSENAIKSDCVYGISIITKETANKSSISRKIASKYKSSDSTPAKLAYVRMIGSTGTPEALEILTSALKSDDLITKLAATRGFSKWPNLKPADALIDAYTNAGASASKLRKDIFSFLSTNSEAPTDQLVAVWKKMINAATNEKEKRQIVGTITSRNNPVSLAIIDWILADPNADEASKERAEEMKDRHTDENEKESEK